MAKGQPPEGSAGRRSLPGATWALPLAFVLYFLHVDFRPKLSVGLVSVDVADLAVLYAIAAALLLADGEDVRVFVRSRRLWLTLALFVAFVFAACFYPLFDDSAYQWKHHLVTWAKLPEFMLLGAAGSILLRRRGVLQRLLVVAVALAACAAVVAVAQFAGLHILHSWPSGGRQPSFTGIDELGMIGGVALSIGFLGLFWSLVDSRLATAALAAGVVCVVFSGAVAAGVGVGGAAVVALAVAWRRGAAERTGVAAVAVSIALCAVGILALRAGSIAQFARYIGLAKKEHTTTNDVQTYSQRLLQLYIGVRVWHTHPLVGAGWSSIREQQVYGPQLPAAHRRFPNQPPLAFPSPQHPWGIDNAYVEVLAELGAIGLVLFLLPLAVAVWAGGTTSLRGPPEVATRGLLGLLWLVVALGIWLGQGLTVSSIADTAWLAIGLIATSAAAAALTNSSTAVGYRHGP